MQRVHLLIWLLMLGLAGAHLGPILAPAPPCCESADDVIAPSENRLASEDIASIQSAAAHPCCRPGPADAPADTRPASHDDDTHDRDHRHQPCKCPSQCCLVGKVPVTFVTDSVITGQSGPAARQVPEWREPLPNPTLNRLKRPPRPHATA